jgi:hypothetical protein
MNKTAKNKQILTQLCERLLRTKLVSEKAAGRIESVSACQRPEFAPHLEFLRSESLSASEAALGLKYGIEKSHIHRLLVGQRPLTEGIAARIAKANPQSWFRWAPSVPTATESPKSPESPPDVLAHEDLTSWIESAKTALRMWLAVANSAIERSSESDILLISDEYRELYGALANESAIAAGALPAPVTSGPAVELAECIARMRSLRTECESKASAAALNNRSEDALRLRTVQDAVREKLRNLIQRVTMAQSLDGKPWQRITDSLYSALQSDATERGRIALMVNSGNALMRDAAEHLRSSQPKAEQ